ncbi:MAG: 4Fe-4S dicluster domain-containing protein [Euryarchaeota archaeon]|nr:4Fe-4S dicluster domain-containing protein [Euryarchaeota archaeon]
MAYAMLVDTTKCTGCRGCQVACKRWNELSPEKTTLSGEWTNPPDLTGQTWTVVFFKEMSKGGEMQWKFTKWQCMHCEEPPCASVCPSLAISKTPEGPVVIDTTRCIGCKYCVEACPFDAVRFDSRGTQELYGVKLGGIKAGDIESGGGSVGVARKCHMCYNRIAQGRKPACVETCLTGAIQFGDRAEIIQKAKTRAAAVNGYVYGEKEAGGTSVVYVLDAPPQELGLPAVTPKRYSEVKADMYKSIGGFGIIGAIILGLVYYFTKPKAEEAK